MALCSGFCSGRQGATLSPLNSPINGLIPQASAGGRDAKTDTTPLDDGKKLGKAFLSTLCQMVQDGAGVPDAAPLR